MIMNQKGFTHIAAMLGIALVLVGVVGFTGYKIYDKKNIKAKAAVGWTVISRGTWYGKQVNTLSCNIGNSSSTKGMKAYIQNQSDYTVTGRFYSGPNFSVPPHSNSSVYLVGGASGNGGYWGSGIGWAAVSPYSLNTCA